MHILGQDFNCLRCVVEAVDRPFGFPKIGAKSFALAIQEGVKWEFGPNNENVAQSFRTGLGLRGRNPTEQDWGFVAAVLSC